MPLPPKKPVATGNKAPKKAATAAPAAKKAPLKKMGAAAPKKAAPGKEKAAPSPTKETAKPEIPENLGMTIKLAELSNQVMGEEAEFRKSGRWPLVVDPAGTSATFLRYRNVNMIEAFNPANIQPEAIRLAVLGGLRYGKPVVLDMDDADLFDVCVKQFDLVQKDLMDELLSKEILKNDKYLSLVKDDGPEYEAVKFLSEVDNFTFIITSKIAPPPALKKRVFLVEIN